MTSSSTKRTFGRARRSAVSAFVGAMTTVSLCIAAAEANAQQSTYTGASATEVQFLLARVPGWNCGTMGANGWENFTTPRMALGGTQRETYVAGAVTTAWAIECESRAYAIRHDPQLLTFISSAVESMRQNLRMASELCTPTPTRGGGVDIWPCGRGLSSGGGSVGGGASGGPGTGGTSPPSITAGSDNLLNDMIDHSKRNGDIARAMGNAGEAKAADQVTEGLVAAGKVASALSGIFGKKNSDSPPPAAAASSATQPTATPVTAASAPLPPHVLRNAQGLYPEPGYHWVDRESKSDLRVEADATETSSMTEYRRLMTKGVTLAQANNRRDAIAAFEEARQHNPYSADVLLQLSTAHMKEGSYETGLALARQASGIVPANRAAYQLIAYGYLGIREKWFSLDSAVKVARGSGSRRPSDGVAAKVLEQYADSAAAYADSALKYDNLSKNMFATVSVTAFGAVSNGAEIAGIVTNNSSSQRFLVLAVEFIDDRGRTVATQSVEIAGLQPGAAKPFTVTAAGANIMAYRYSFR